MRKYENIVKDICNINWDKLQENKDDPDTQREIDGWIGVSCMLAFMKGINPTGRDMARHFGVPQNTIDIPLKRLLSNGVFSSSYDIKNDSVILGKNCDGITTKRAWVYIAGISSGFVGLMTGCR
tara:strand:+ start:6 stop:377 length:372 start_codon:yes stop_codon:yes gene_type:complete